MCLFQALFVCLGNGYKWRKVCQVLPYQSLFFVNFSYSIVVKTKNFCLVYEWRSVLNCKPEFYATKSASHHSFEWQIISLLCVEMFHAALLMLSTIPLGDTRFCCSESHVGLWNSAFIWFYNSFAKVLHLWSLNI
jgi:hypothetical protein